VPRAPTQRRRTGLRTRRSQYTTPPDHPGDLDHWLPRRTPPPEHAAWTGARGPRRTGAGASRPHARGRHGGPHSAPSQLKKACVVGTAAVPGRPTAHRGPDLSNASTSVTCPPPPAPLDLQPTGRGAAGSSLASLPHFFLRPMDRPPVYLPDDPSPRSYRARQAELVFWTPTVDRAMASPIPIECATHGVVVRLVWLLVPASTLGAVKACACPRAACCLVLAPPTLAGRACPFHPEEC